MSQERPVFEWQPGEQWPPQSAVEWAQGLNDEALVGELGQSFSWAPFVRGPQTVESVQPLVALGFGINMLENHRAAPEDLHPTHISDAAAAVALRAEFVQRLSMPGEPPRGTGE